MFPRTVRLRLLAGAAAMLLVLAAVLVVMRGEDPAPQAVGTGPATTPSQAPTTATTPAATAQIQFPTDCEAVSGSRPLGLGIPRPARLAQSPVEQAVFAASFTCLRSIGGGTPMLRTQLPIDVTRRRGEAGGFEYSELTAFAALLKATGAAGIVSIRSHDFTRCSLQGQNRPAPRATLKADQALEPCEYPSIPLYEQLFTELHDQLVALAPDAQLWFSAWNEPDHPMFTLQPAYGQRVAARRAGKYWSVVAGIVGAERALAGEFSDQDLPTLLSLRDAFVDGTGGLTPAVWALHPYRDLTGGSDAVQAGFSQAVAPSPVWLTETTPRISGRGGLSGRPQAQRRRGAALRRSLTASKTPLILYLLTPPAPPASEQEDGWDSALADRAGSARPFICGLADLPAARCPGNPEAFGS